MSNIEVNAGGSEGTPWWPDIGPDTYFEGSGHYGSWYRLNNLANKTHGVGEFLLQIYAEDHLDKGKRIIGVNKMKARVRKVVPANFSIG